MDNKRLTEKIARNLGRDKSDVGKLLEAFASIVASRCGQGDTIAIPGFGTFVPEKHRERVVTDLSTGKRTLMPPCVTLDFKVSNVLKNKIKA